MNFLFFDAGTTNFGTKGKERPEPVRRTVLWVLLSGVSYYLATQIAWALCSPNNKVSLFFPLHAVFISVLLLVPTRHWWAYTLAAVGGHFLATQQAHRPFFYSLHCEACDAVKCVSAAAGLRILIKSPLRLITLREAIVFVLIAVVIVAFGTAFWGAAFTISNHFGTHYWVEWRNLGISNAVTAILMVPASLLGAHRLARIQSIRQMPRVWRMFQWAALAGCLLLIAPLSEAQSPVRQVLVLQSFNRGVLQVDYFTGNFRVDLEQRAGGPVNFIQIVVGPTGFVGAPEQAVVDFVRSTFSEGQKPDLIVTIAAPAAAFARRHRPELFPDTPLLFAAADQRFFRAAPPGGNETAVMLANDFPRLFDEILQLLPQTRQVFMVSDSGQLARNWRQQLEGELKRFNERLAFTWSNDLSLPEILRRCATLPSNSVIVYLTFGVDARGGAYSDERVLADLHAVANAPMFAAHSPLFGHGIVGGSLIPVDDLSRSTAEAAVRILNGAPPGSITVPPTGAGKPVFDWRELKRWGIPESRLPAGSEVRFRVPTFWEQYKWQSIGVLLVVLGQAAIVVVLVRSLLRGKRAEGALRASELKYRNVVEMTGTGYLIIDLQGRVLDANQEYVRISGHGALREIIGRSVIEWTTEKAKQQNAEAVAQCAKDGLIRNFVTEYTDASGKPTFVEVNAKVEGEGESARIVSLCRDITERKRVEDALQESEARFRTVAKSVPVLIWMTGPDKLCSFVNKGWLDFTGRSLEQELGTGWAEGVHPEDAARCLEVCASSYDTRQEFRMEFRLRRGDGTYGWLLDTGVPRFAHDGTFLGYIGSCVDITERREAEAELRASQERMTMAAEAAQLGLWTWDIAGNSVWLTDKLRELFGFSATEEVTYESFRTRVHQDDRAEVNQAVELAIVECSRYHVEYRMVRPDGTMRWMAGTGRVKPDSTGAPALMLGVSMDITERRRAEEESRELSGKLITAQEDERKRIARDLHDDLNQRLALLSIEMEIFGSASTDTSGPARERLNSMTSRVKGLSSEVHRLSYQLHPAKLDQLGLVVAARTFCREVSIQSGLAVHFEQNDVPRDVGADVALCLYRVIQEALQNSVRHSGGSAIQVRLTYADGQLRLLISDEGKGFDVNHAIHHGGLGLVSMRERVRQVHGSVHFVSSPGRGTRTEVNVPLLHQKPVV